MGAGVIISRKASGPVLWWSSVIAGELWWSALIFRERIRYSGVSGITGSVIAGVDCSLEDMRACL